MNKLMHVCILLLTALILSACANAPAPTEALPPVAATDEPVMTEEPVSSTEIPTETATEAPTEAPTETPEESGPAALEGEAQIDVANFKFDPNNVTIRVGTTVTWTNKSEDEHTVTSDDGLFGTSLAGGTSFSFTFTDVGEFSFHCDIHRGMKGKIVVVE